LRDGKVSVAEAVELGLLRVFGSKDAEVVIAELTNAIELYFRRAGDLQMTNQGG
jgi:hypothetical protein